MSIATDNRVTELESQVKKLTQQVQELSAMLKPASASLLHPKPRGRPPKQVTQ